MDQKDNSGQVLRAAAGGRSVLRGVIAAYLVYLGGSLISGWFRGTSTVKPVLVWTCGPLFIIGGLLFGLYAWRQWKAAQREAEAAETAAAPPDPAPEAEEPEK